MILTNCLVSNVKLCAQTPFLNNEFNVLIVFSLQGQNEINITHSTVSNLYSL